MKLHKSAFTLLHIEIGNMITMLQPGAAKRFVSWQSFHTAFAWWNTLATEVNTSLNCLYKFTIWECILISIQYTIVQASQCYFIYKLGFWLGIVVKCYTTNYTHIIITVGLVSEYTMQWIIIGIWKHDIFTLLNDSQFNSMPGQNYIRTELM